MRYSEKKEISKIYKTHYVNGIERLIEKREQECLTRRREYFQASAARQEEYRRELKSILGWPLNGYNVEGVGLHHINIPLRTTLCCSPETLQRSQEQIRSRMSRLR